jgi:adenylate cyclase
VTAPLATPRSDERATNFIEPVTAVVWYSDMRAYTEHIKGMTLADIVHLLDDYFDSVASPIERLGGEIIKFLGDAVLATFRADSGAEACRAALRASRQARANVFAWNQRRSASGSPPVNFDIALVAAEVAYTTIGTPSRRDSTIVGREVNLAGRIEQLCEQVDVPLLASESFIRMGNIEARPIGSFLFKGFDVHQVVYAV